MIWAEDGDTGSRPSIRVWRPGEQPTAFEIDARDAEQAALEMSPDARRVLVRASHRAGDAMVADVLAVLDPASGRWTEFPASGLRGYGEWWGRWASSTSILLQRPGRHGSLVQITP